MIKLVFSDLNFIIRFLPAFLLIYYITPKRFRNFVLLGGSIIFYTIGEPYAVFLLLLSVLLNYLLAFGIAKRREKPAWSKIWLILGLFLNVGLLVGFKYLDFLFENYNFLINMIPQCPLKTAPLTGLVIPIGLSFFTFQAIAYLVDVYRKDIEPVGSFWKFSSYMLMFPRLVQGPIVRYSEVGTEMNSRRIEIKNVEKGVGLFVVGLASKVLLADPLGTLFTDIRVTGFESVSTPMAWLGAIAFSLQIYFDFAGYSLMAVGLGELLGFHLPWNFDHPYLSRSVSEFWRKWHMTLGRWFRDYIYIPLGGSRKNKFITIRNLFIVWILTGLWHGAGWNFLLWGFVTFLFIALEKLVLKKLLDKWRILSHLYMFAYIPLSWMLFAITDLGELGIYMKKLFCLHDPAIYVNELDVIMGLKDYGVLLLAGLICCSRLPVRIYEKWGSKLWMKAVLFLLFWFCVFRIAGSVNNPFLYLRF